MSENKDVEHCQRLVDAACEGSRWDDSDNFKVWRAIDVKCCFSRTVKGLKK